MVSLPSSQPRAGEYRIAEFSPFADQIDAGRFYDESYDETLAALTAHVLKAEAPILDRLLVQRIARAHGFQRSGSRIADRVLEVAERNHYPKPDPGGDTFVWLAREDPGTWNQYRTPVSDQDLRRIEEIASEELCAAAKACIESETALEVCKLFGIRRLTEQAKDRIHSCVSPCENPLPA